MPNQPQTTDMIPSRPEIDEEGYEIVPDNPQMILQSAIGRKCGRCGIKIKYGVGYGFRCADQACPLGWNL